MSEDWSDCPDCKLIAHMLLESGAHAQAKCLKHRTTPEPLCPIPPVSVKERQADQQAREHVAGRRKVLVSAPLTHFNAAAVHRRRQLAAQERAVWLTHALTHLKAYAQITASFTADAFREYAVSLTAPSHPNIWGGLFRIAAKRGWVIKSQRLQRSERRAAHGRAVPIWFSRVCPEIQQQVDREIMQELDLKSARRSTAAVRKDLAAAQAEIARLNGQVAELRAELQSLMPARR